MNIRSVLAILSYILIGAVATGAGTGFFLYRANVDRSELMESKVQAEIQAEELLVTSKEIAEEANEKLEQASEEVAKTRERLRLLEEERRMINQATPLARSTKTQYWKEVMSLPLGVTTRVPSLAQEIQNDESALVVGSENAETPWLEVKPYNKETEIMFRQRLENASEVFFLVSGQLFVGAKGSLPESKDQGYALRVQLSGTSTVLIWAKENSGFKSSDIIDTFSSFTFRS